MASRERNTASTISNGMDQWSTRVAFRRLQHVTRLEHRVPVMCPLAVRQTPNVDRIVVVGAIWPPRKHFEESM